MTDRYVDVVFYNPVTRQITGSASGPFDHFVKQGVPFVVGRGTREEHEIDLSGKLPRIVKHRDGWVDPARREKKRTTAQLRQREYVQQIGVAAQLEAITEYLMDGRTEKLNELREKIHKIKDEIRKGDDDGHD